MNVLVRTSKWVGAGAGSRAGRWEAAQLSCSLGAEIFWFVSRDTDAGVGHPHSCNNNGHV